jgi:hypothetical protein
MKTNILLLSLVATTLVTLPFEHFSFKDLGDGKAIAQNVKPIPKVAQATQEWNAGMRLLRVFDDRGNFLGIGIQLDVLNKPFTKYANVVYQLSVGKEGRWLDLYSSVGARLLPKAAGSLAPAIEIISIDEIANQLGTSVNALPELDLKARVLIKYDTRDLREQLIGLESIQAFGAIAQASTRELSNRQPVARPTQTPPAQVEIKPARPQTVTPPRPVPAVSPPAAKPPTVYPSNPNVDPSDAELGISGDIYPRQKSLFSFGSKPQAGMLLAQDPFPPEPAIDSNEIPPWVDPSTLNIKPHRGHFSLAILRGSKLGSISPSQVIARISLKSKRANGYLRERYLGDYLFSINQRATFVKGSNPEDRVVVRLFDLKNQLLGYTEFELLEDFATVNLILPSDASANGTLRTVYGLDVNQLGSIDRGTSVYDYYTQLVPSEQKLKDTTVRFLTDTRNINFDLFKVNGIPLPSIQPVFTNLFAEGANSLIKSPVKAFTLDLDPNMMVFPQQVVPLIPIASNRPTYEVITQILKYKDIALPPSEQSTIFSD